VAISFALSNRTCTTSLWVSWICAVTMNGLIGGNAVTAWHTVRPDFRSSWAHSALIDRIGAGQRVTTRLEPRNL
jgi:hypothetical protein